MLLSELLRRSAKVGGRVHLLNVRLISTDCAVEGAVLEADATLQVTTDLQTGFLFNPESGELGVRVDYGIRTHLKDAPTASIYRIRTTWHLEYVLNSVEGIEQLDAEAFSVTSGPFAAHPYQRELVQRISGQMGFTPLVLDVLRSPTDIATEDDREIELAGEQSPAPVETDH